MSAPDAAEWVASLLPGPRRWRLDGAGCALSASSPIDAHPSASGESRAARERVARALAALPSTAGAPVELVLAPAPSREAHRVRVGERGVRLEAATSEGLFRAATTFAQLVALVPRATGTARLPGLVLEDEPLHAVRGLSLDVSRDRVPTPEALRALVERLADWKLNRLELYLEHAFAHEGHETVWRAASPIEPAELAALDAFARERFVTLVPCQQSLGHMHRWLKHEAYRHLAEVPEGIEHAFSLEREPYGLCPTDPRALELVDELHGNLAELVASPTLGVGLDEPIDLGRGRSRAACEARGAPAVYLDWARALHERLDARDRRMELYADYALAEPEVLAGLPRDALAVAWGYDAQHDLEGDATRLAEAGLEHLVAPGTSSWQSLFGRPANARANLVRAERAARASGALGIVVCDWGDRGHWQAPAASWPGIARAAALAWSGELGAADDERLGPTLDRFALGEPGLGLSALWLELGRACELAAPARNGDALFFALAFAPEPWPHPRLAGLSLAALDEIGATLARGRAAAEALRPASVEGRLVREELYLGVELGELAAALACLRLSGDARPVAALPPSARRAVLAERLRALEERFEERWLARSRPGGLADSLARLQRVRGPLGLPSGEVSG